MTLLTRWDPFRELTTLQDRMNRLFQEAPLPSNEALMTTGFVPAVDVYEDEQAITVKMEIPGIEMKDLDVRLENNTLTVKGERKFEKEEKEENFHRIERRYGAFSRSFTLPNTIESEGVVADCENGLLKIRLPKKAEAKPKQIKVQVGQKTLESKGRAA
ncbi:MAG TPA: Hsp20/alpha crystallin family protein [Candidatus Acidoferrales bacterium]|nr:Hsp20/alpha crystallin family protein [Candidatus Acidoferrales bacterium]